VRGSPGIRWLPGLLDLLQQDSDEKIYVGCYMFDDYRGHVAHLCVNDLTWWGFGRNGEKVTLDRVVEAVIAERGQGSPRRALQVEKPVTGRKFRFDEDER